jgi:hypothetical protein
MEGALILLLLIVSLLAAGCTVQSDRQNSGSGVPATTKTDELSPGDITYTDDNER